MYEDTWFRGQSDTRLPPSVALCSFTLIELSMRYVPGTQQEELCQEGEPWPASTPLPCVGPPI